MEVRGLAGPIRWRASVRGRLPHFRRRVDTQPDQMVLGHHLFFTATPASLPSGGTWVFTQPQFLILNLAVGGNWPGNPMQQRFSPSKCWWTTSAFISKPRRSRFPRTQSNGSVVLSWPTNIVCHLQTQTNSLVGGVWFDQTNTTSPVVLNPDPNQASVFFRLASP